jgi:DNA-binding NarL/FixJ family response regulator
MREIARWRSTFPLVHLAEASALAGDADGAAAASAEADSLLAGAGVFEGLARRARGWVALARGERTTATDLLLDAARWSGSHGHGTAEVLALHDVVRLDGSRRVAARLAELAPATEGPWASAVAAHARAVTDDDADALDAAATTFQEIGALLLAAEVAAQAAAAFRRRSLVSRADRSAARARVLLARCEGARSPVLADLEGALPLTAREREVAHLAAEGLSASAVAERLFVSTRTVEGHLQRIYTKLGVHDRAGLALLLER